MPDLLDESLKCSRIFLQAVGSLSVVIVEDITQGACFPHGAHRLVGFRLKDVNSNQNRVRGGTPPARARRATEIRFQRVQYR